MYGYDKYRDPPRINSMALIQKDCRHVWSTDPEPECIKCGLVGEVDQHLEFQVGKFKYVHTKHCPKEYLEGKMRQLAGAHDGLLDRIDKEVALFFNTF